MHEERNKAGEQMRRSGYEIVAKSNLSKIYRVGMDRVVVDLAPLSRLLSPQETNVYYRIIHGDNIHISKMGVVEYSSLANKKKLHFLNDQEHWAFRNLPSESVHLETRTIDELVAMEFGAPVDDVKLKIVDMYRSVQDGIPGRPSFYYNIKKDDVQIIDYDPKLPFEIVSGKLLRVRYLIDRIKGPKGESCQRWIPVANLISSK